MTDSGKEQNEKYYLHPGIMDAAVQTIMALEANGKGQPALPFALQDIIIYKATPSKVFAHVRFSKGVEPGGEIAKFDIDVADETGVICVALKGLTVRVYNTVGKDEMLYATPIWECKQLENITAKKLSNQMEGTLFLCGIKKDMEKSLIKEFPGLNVQTFLSKNDTAIITENFLKVFSFIKDILKRKPKEHSKVLIVAQRSEMRRDAYIALNGLLKTAHSENPNFVGKVIEVDENQNQLSYIITKEFDNTTFDEVEIRYLNGLKREVKKLKEVKYDLSISENISIKEDRIYWITGGMGGLGLILAKDLCKIKDVKVILSGRTELNSSNKDQFDRKSMFSCDGAVWITGGTGYIGLACAKHFLKYYGIKKFVLMGRAQLPNRSEWKNYLNQNVNDSIVWQKLKSTQFLESHGAKVAVLSVGLKDKEELIKSLAQIKQEFGKIEDVFHAAGTMDTDNLAFICKKAETIQSVTDPKIGGLDVLHEVFKEEKLKFFLLFPSVSGIVPALGSGQSDYAMANVYMDYFAQYQSAQGYGYYKSIQWPNWEEAGMGDVSTKNYRESGLLSHTNSEGFQLLDKLLLLPVNKRVILPAIVDKDCFNPDCLLVKKLKTKYADSSVAKTDNLVIEDKNIYLKTVTWLKELFGNKLKINQNKLDEEIPFQNYGVDSILLAQFVKDLDNVFQDIKVDPSSFLEHTTISSFAKYLLNENSDVLYKLFKENKNVEVPIKQICCEQSQQSVSPSLKSPKGLLNKERCKVAVIGMACHFPDAVNISDYIIGRI